MSRSYQWCLRDMLIYMNESYPYNIVDSVVKLVSIIVNYKMKSKIYNFKCYMEMQKRLNYMFVDVWWGWFYVFGHFIYPTYWLSMNPIATLDWIIWYSWWLSFIVFCMWVIGVWWIHFSCTDVIGMIVFRIVKLLNYIINYILH